MLYMSLNEGGTTKELFRMFPLTKDIIAPQIDHMLALSSQMKALENMMAKSGHTPIPLDRSLRDYLDEDDMDTEPLRIATNDSKASGDSVQNFLASFGKV